MGFYNTKGMSYLKFYHPFNYTKNVNWAPIMGSNSRIPLITPGYHWDQSLFQYMYFEHRIHELI